MRKKHEGVKIRLSDLIPFHQRTSLFVPSFRVCSLENGRDVLTRKMKYENKLRRKYLNQRNRK